MDEQQLELGVDPSWGRHFLPRELAKMFYNAGWTDAQKLLDAVSVCIAESNAYEKRKHVNDDGSIDRGIWMINNVAHPDVSDAVAYDAVKATAVARNIYKSRSYTFKAWAAYNNGRYKLPTAMGYAAPGIGNFLLEKNGLPLSLKEPV